MAELKRIPRHGARGLPSSWSAEARPGSRSPGRSPSCEEGATGQLQADRPGCRQGILFDGGKEILGVTFGDWLSEWEPAS